MRRRRKITILIISLVAFIMAACLTAFLLTFDVKVSLNDEKITTAEVFSDFKDPGAKGYITISKLGFKKEIKVKTENDIEVTKLGEYRIEYLVSFLWKKASVYRKVDVVDTQPPEITADANITVDFVNKENVVNIEDIPISFAAKDNYDGDITHTVVKTYEKDGCVLTATDYSGNSASYKVMFDFADKEAPKIQLASTLPLYLAVGEQYNTANVSATDNVDGDVTKDIKVSNLPDTTKAGTYSVTYEVTDASNNTASVSQKVIVYNKWDSEKKDTIIPSEKTIYLTFDDGPGAHTEYLLKMLRHYDVKATFFVTDQFSQYRDLIRIAYKLGHTIGAHTSSHRFDTIYSSIENYLADFEKIQSVIKEQTKKETKIFRFPGGTSNTVSQKYATGIMKALSNEMTNRGYTYFDWNFDCGDTAGKTKEEIVNGVLNHIDTRFKTENYTIILMHDIKIETIKALPKIIEYCLNKGYSFAPLNENSPNRQFDAKN